MCIYLVIMLNHKELMTKMCIYLVIVLDHKEIMTKMSIYLVIMLSRKELMTNMCIYLVIMLDHKELMRITLIHGMVRLCVRKWVVILLKKREFKRKCDLKAAHNSSTRHPAQCGAHECWRRAGGALCIMYK